MKIVWEDETAVFLLLPALTFTAYNYTVEPPESYHLKCKDPQWFLSFLGTVTSYKN